MDDAATPSADVPAATVMASAASILRRFETFIPSLPLQDWGRNRPGNPPATFINAFNLICMPPSCVATYHVVVPDRLPVETSYSQPQVVVNHKLWCARSTVTNVEVGGESRAEWRDIAGANGEDEAGPHPGGDPRCRWTDFRREGMAWRPDGRRGKGCRGQHSDGV